MPNPQIPTWLIGTAVTNLTVTPLTLGADGTLTPGTTQSLTGHLDAIDLKQENVTEPVMPLDNRLQNDVIVASRTELTLAEILTHSAGNFLAAVANASDYCSATFSRGGLTFTGNFVVLSYREGIRRGKSVGTLSLGPCGLPVQWA